MRDENLGLPGGGQWLQASRQPRRDRRGERAAAAVRVAGVDAPGGQLRHLVAVEEDVDGVAARMAALDDHRARAELEQGACRGASLVESFDCSIQQHPRFGHVGRDDRRQGEQLCAQRLNGFVAQQLGPTLGHHHRIDHEPGDSVITDRIRHRLDDRGRREHAGLGRAYFQVAHDRVDLRADELCGQLEDVRHVDSVLRGDRRDRRRAVHAERRKSFQVGLDTRAAA